MVFRIPFEGNRGFSRCDKKQVAERAALDELYARIEIERLVVGGQNRGFGRRLDEFPVFIDPDDLDVLCMQIGREKHGCQCEHDLT